MQQKESPYSSMKKRTPLFLLFLFLVSTASTIVFLSITNQERTKSFTSKQQETFITFTASAIRIGLSEGLIEYIKETFQQLHENPNFYGGAVYDADHTTLLTMPSGFKVPERVFTTLEKFKHENNNGKSEEILKHAEGSISYEILALDSHKEIIGYLILAFDNSALDATSKASLLYTIILALGLTIGGGLTLFFLSRYIEHIYRQNVELDIEKRKAQESDRLKTEFLATVSHELRTPMNGIIGSCDILEDLDMDTEQRDCARTISYSAKRLMTLLNDLLDFSKIEAGEMELEQVPIRLHKLLEKTVHTLSHTAQGKGLSLELDIESSVPTGIMGDPNRLQQILLNLIGNAIKFTEEGCIHIYVSSNEQEGEIQTVIFSIKDSGIGISEEHLGFIFDKFRQVSSSIARKFEGTGLGLAIVQDLITLMKGDISVESEKGKGSTFQFKIPFELLQDLDILTNSEHQTEQPSYFSFKGYSVLAVDDDSVNTFIIEKMLNRLNFSKIELAHGGNESIKKFQDNNFDLVLMDCRMPDIDGYTATKEMRKIEKSRNKNKHTPIIALTADATKGVYEKCIIAGMDDRINKPITKAQLSEAIAMYLKPTSKKTEEGKDNVSVTSESVENGEHYQQANHSNGIPPLDKAYFEKVVELPLEDSHKILELFYSQARDCIEKLEVSLNRSDNSQEWADAAHKLKGSSSIIGAMPLRELCAEAQGAKNKSRDVKAEILDNIRFELKKLQDYIG
ncbi:MAG: hypothetical protein COA45_04660 [Zetaproteobacteria bacterium]|nr:MAG: hypothetical protein COA45_04660 [Zetaproteobacteria bacterium]